MLDKDKIINEIEIEIESANSKPYSPLYYLEKLKYGIKQGLFNVTINKNESCTWKFETPNRYMPYYKTSCGKNYTNRYRDGIYCPYCGKTIDEVRGERTL